MVKGDSCLVIDPGAEIDRIKKEINGKKIKGILVTHHHFDHVRSLNYFPQDIIYSSFNLKEGNHQLGPFNFEVIYTKGHSSDSISFYFYEENILFSGDFLFYENIGRCDLPTGNFDEMLKSISKIKKYNDNIIIYPGHGDKTTLQHEKDKNIYFK